MFATLRVARRKGVPVTIGIGFDVVGDTALSKDTLEARFFGIHLLPEGGYQELWL